MNVSARFVLLLLLAWLTPCYGESMEENRLKSAYVLNFAKFTEWPAETVWPGNKITLCTLGIKVLDGALVELAGRKAGGRELQVIQGMDADSDLRACHLVFIGKSERRSVANIIKALEHSPALTISDIDDFAEIGGGIGLLYRGNRIVFEVNLESTRKSRLHLPGKLLNLAYNVIGR